MLVYRSGLVWKLGGAVDEVKLLNKIRGMCGSCGGMMEMAQQRISRAYSMRRRKVEWSELTVFLDLEEEWEEINQVACCRV